MNIIAFEADGGYKLAISLDKKDLAFTKAIFLSDIEQGLTYDARKYLEEPPSNWNRPCVIPALASRGYEFLLDFIWVASTKQDRQITTKVIADHKVLINILQALREQTRNFKETLTHSLIITKIKVKMTK